MQKEMSGLRLELEEREDKIDEYEERIAELTQQLGEDGLKRSMDSLKKPSFDRKVCCIRLLPSSATFHDFIANDVERSPYY